ncbi:hypothetical protein Tco_0810700 [Tanacetum coccineum]
MSETEPIPPTSSVTALRIPIIKKGEYDLWSMKMRQYIAITDHILWDIITNGNQTTTDPASPSVSAPKTSLAANARRNNEKALNILLSAIPDRHLLSFHDAVDARSLWKAIKARFGGNEASKKMQKNLLKQQFETFTIGSREELDSAYERFQHILSMLELHDAAVSIEDANLKFLRSLPSVWHVVATMIRGQPRLDELDFDDLYNNLKVYEHELKGVLENGFFDDRRIVFKLVIIMAQPQQSADVHQDELCPPNKRYAIMDTNKKVDLDNPLCLDGSRILANVGILDLIRQKQSYQLPQATDNNHDHFVPASKFTVIRLRIPPRRSTRLTPPTPIPTTDEADDLVLQDKLQVSLAEQKITKELKLHKEEKVKRDTDD